MTTEPKRELPTGAILVLLLFLCLLGGTWILLSSVSVSGSATLPNGVPVAISSGFRGFSAAENGKITRIEIAGFKIEFETSRIMVDGAQVGTIDDSMTHMTLTANRDGVTLAADDNVIWSSE